MDENGAARRKRAELEDIQKDREEDFRGGGGLLPRESVRNLHGANRRDDDLLRVAAARKQRHRPLALAPAADLGADLYHFARTLKAKNRGCAGGRRIEALALEEVRPVHRRRHHAQAQVLRTGGRCGELAEAKHALVPGRVEHDRLHRRVRYRSSALE